MNYSRKSLIAQGLGLVALGPETHDLKGIGCVFVLNKLSLFEQEEAYFLGFACRNRQESANCDNLSHF
jgi:hypothetical protein